MGGFGQNKSEGGYPRAARARSLRMSTWILAILGHILVSGGIFCPKKPFLREPPY